jgi:phosphatidylethanolamine/phosphatidyl-N-methylethanolamine N-methyltransferase
MQRPIDEIRFLEPDWKPRRSSSAVDAPQSRSTATVTNGFVERVYSRLSPVYDLLFNRILQPGRVTAARRMGQSGGDVLEVGVGTALSVSLYPRNVRVTGIDLSAPMLAKARDRVARSDRSCRLLRMDAADLSFADNTFDFVYAPYTVSVVPDPVRVVREMHRVCKPGGVVLILNHFLSSDPLIARFERALSPLTIHFGFRSDLDLVSLLDDAGLKAASVDAANHPPIWRLVTCVKDGRIDRQLAGDRDSTPSHSSHTS